MKNTWIIVANQGGARVFGFEKPKGILRFVKKLENPEGRLKDGEIDSDRPGRSFSSAGAERHAYAEPTSSTEVVAVNFARELSQFIENARSHQEFESLILVTAPKFLGYLRKNLSSSTSTLIEHSVDLNLGSLTDEQVTSHVESILKEKYSRPITRDHVREENSTAKMTQDMSFDSEATETEALDSEDHPLKIQVNTDHNIHGSEELQEKIKSVVENRMKYFAERLSRIEVYLKDINGPKSGRPDIRCLLEARPRGMEPLSVSDKASTILQAVDGASKKLEHLLKSTFGRLDQRATGRETSRDYTSSTDPQDAI